MSSILSENRDVLRHKLIAKNAQQNLKVFLILIVILLNLNSLLHHWPYQDIPLSGNVLSIPTWTSFCKLFYVNF